MTKRKELKDLKTRKNKIVPDTNASYKDSGPPSKTQQPQQTAQRYDFVEAETVDL